MNVRGLWAAVAIAAISLVCVTVLLALRVDTTAIVAVISVVAVPIIGAVLYAKIDRVSEQTNGTQTRQNDVINGLIEHLKTHNSTPIQSPATDTTEADKAA